MLPTRKTAIPGAKSLLLAGELRRSENPNITFLDPERRFPVFWESASGSLVTDVDGNSYLDLTAAFGVMGVGHSNPRVVGAIQKQAAVLIHGMGDVHPSGLKVRLAEKIAEHSPGDLGYVIFGLNGGDAVEAALKSARLATGKPGVLAFRSGYHGLTMGALAVTERADFRTPFSGQVPQFGRHVPFCDPVSCSFSCKSCTRACLSFVESAFRDYGDTLGAVIVEPIQGRGGIVEPPPGYLPGLRDLCDRYGMLLIADEIFTGWGRTGDYFACDAEGVVPDILCMGKAMGGGFPISACAMRPDVAAAWGTSTGEAMHTSTFLGHPLACAASLAAIGEIESRDLPARAKTVGAYFKARLHELAARFPAHIAEVRGRGLMLGVRFHKREVALGLVYELLQRGLIVLPAGGGDVIELVPPLVIEHEQIDFAIKQITAALDALSV
ncbi:MAG: aspartate aminotransferase family protein [Armatimonadetes bacterium]|nr:aspartate aminotransferase family protein [Armatimonadota bacterium]